VRRSVITSLVLAVGLLLLGQAAGAFTHLRQAAGGTRAVVVSARLPLDQIDAGNTTPDISGSGSTGKSVSATVVGGKYANALSFPSVGDGFLIDDNENLHPQTLTISTWVKYTRGINDHSRTIVGKGAGDAAPRKCSSHSWALRNAAGDGTPNNPTTGLQFYVNVLRPDSTQEFLAPPIIPYNEVYDGTWHAVAASYGNGSASLYLDGNLKGTATLPAGVIGPVDYTSGHYSNSQVGVARYPDPSCSLEGFRFPGALDDLRIYDRVLTQAQIQAIHTATSPAPDPPLSSTATPTPTPTGTATTTATAAPTTTAAPTATATPVVAANVELPELEQTPKDGDKTLYRCNEGIWKGLAAKPNFTRLIYERTLSGGEKFVAGGGGIIIANTASKRLLFCRVSADTAAGGRITVDGPILAVPNVRSIGFNNVLKQKTVGDFRIRGIDVLQVTQPTSGAGMFEYPKVAGFPSICGGGTPTSVRVENRCQWEGKKSQSAEYQGLILDAHKRTSVIVYVDHRFGSDIELTNVPLEVRLHGHSPGRLDASLRQTVTSGQLRGSPYAAVSLKERGDEAYGVRFDLPLTWLDAVASPTSGTFDLDATVSIPPGHPDATQCRQTSGIEAETGGTTGAPKPCTDNDTYKLTDIFARNLTFHPIFRMIAVLSENQPLISLDPAQSVVRNARELYPGGEDWQVSDYSAELTIYPAKFDPDFDTTNKNCPKPAPVKDTNGKDIPETVEAQAARVRTCVNDHVAAVIKAWVLQDGGTGGNIFDRPNGRGYNVLIGVHRYQVPVPTGGLEPGAMFAGSASGMRTPLSQPLIHIDSGKMNRSLTSAGHEIGHAFGASHAGFNPGAGGGIAGDLSCGGDRNSQVGEIWPPDGAGRLQAVSIDPTTRERTVDVDEPIKSAGNVLFDFMSYCAPNDRASISPRNWNQYLQRMIEMEGRRRRAARTEMTKGTGYLVGFFTGSSAVISSTEPARPGNAVPAAEPGSSIVARAFDASGKSLGDFGAHIELNTNGGGGTFSAPLPEGTARVELILDGRKVDERAEGAVPTVKLTAPRGRVRARKNLNVRWNAADPDTSELNAAVEFSADNGKTWRTVTYGVSSGHATVSAKILEASRKARVRVRVSDGFHTAVASSKKIRVDGTRPTAQILRPDAGERIQGGERITLLGQGADDRDLPIKGKRLRWFAGKKRLGRGAKLKVRLPAGKVKLRLVATDRIGRRTVATRKLRVTAPPLRLTKLVTRSVKARARRAVVKVAASRSAVLLVAGKRYRVGPKAHKLRIRLPKRPKAGILRIPLRLKAQGASVKATLIVLRG
jgi:hypothetical protein